MSLVGKHPNSSLSSEGPLIAWFSELRDILNYNYALIKEVAVSSDATIDLKLGTVMNYREYQVKLTSVTVSQDCLLNVRVSDDNGATFKSGGSDYKWGIDSVLYDGTPAQSLTEDASDSEITLMEELATEDSTNRLNGVITIIMPSDSTSYTTIKWDLVYNNASGNLITAKGCGRYLTAAAITAVRLYPSAGTLSAGAITLIGMN